MNSQQNLTEVKSLETNSLKINSIETNSIKKIIYHLTKKVYEDVGLNMAFQFSSYIKTVFDNKMIYYKPDNMYNGFNYFIKIQIVEEVKMNSKIWKHRRCKYCGNKKCDSQLSCCGSNIHYNCALNNNFTCNCINCHVSSKRIILINNDKDIMKSSCECNEVKCNKVKCNEVKCNEVKCNKVKCNEVKCNKVKCNEEHDKNCSICFDECNTKTECGHLVCRKCMDQMYQNEGENTKCPICRNGLYNSMVYIDTYELEIDGRQIKVKANISK